MVIIYLNLGLKPVKRGKFEAFGRERGAISDIFSNEEARTREYYSPLESIATLELG